MKVIKAPGYLPKKKQENPPSRHIKRDPMVLLPLEKKVLEAFLRHGKPTETKHHYQVIKSDVYNDLLAKGVTSYSFSGAVASLKRKGFYNHILWTTNPNKTGYKDHPAKCIRVYGEILRIRSDIALVIDPVFFESRG